jgi:hypothetical protein
MERRGEEGTISQLKMTIGEMLSIEKLFRERELQGPAESLESCTLTNL